MKDVACRDLSGTAALTYMKLRAQLAGSRTTMLLVPESANPRFWERYAKQVRGAGGVRVETAPAGVMFPAPTGQVGVWVDRGLAATYTRLHVRHLRPRELDYGRYRQLVEPVRDTAPMQFVLAVLSAHEGLSAAYLPVMRRLAPDRLASEDPLTFSTLWNDEHDSPRLQSLCSNLTREQLLLATPPEAALQSLDCERDSTTWCGECLSCFESFYAAKAVGRDLGFRLTPAAFDAFYTDRYRTYLDSEFRSEPENELQLLVKLQMDFGLEFDRIADTAG